jgi:flavin-dependent dehydrogenase
MGLGVAVDGLRVDDTGRVVGVYGHDRAGDPVEIEARFVVGADGLTSMVARRVGAEVVEDRGHSGAVRYAYYDGLPWDGIELIVSGRGLAGVFPTHDGQACIWVGSPAADADAIRRGSTTSVAAFTSHLWAVAPELADRLRAGRRTSAVTGMFRMPNLLRRPHGAGWALVGDAGYHRDAVTGYGISDAYRDAELLACALDRVLRGQDGETTALTGYERTRDRSLREVFEVTCAMTAYPPVPDFVELQKRLSRAIDVQATELAERPIPGERQLART